MFPLLSIGLAGRTGTTGSPGRNWNKGIYFTVGFHLQDRFRKLEDFPVVRTSRPDLSTCKENSTIKHEYPTRLVYL